jgi:hypothetical protein
MNWLGDQSGHRQGRSVLVQILEWLGDQSGHRQGRSVLVQILELLAVSLGLLKTLPCSEKNDETRRMNNPLCLTM